MPPKATLDDDLAQWAKSGTPQGEAVAATVLAIAGAVVRIADLLAGGSHVDTLANATGRIGTSDEQKQLDVIANDWLTEALRAAPVAVFVSEEALDPIALTPGAPLVVAADPIDGSSNIDPNAAIGTIFSVLPAMRDAAGAPNVLQPGRNQLAAGFAVYGPVTTLALTLGAGTRLYAWNREAHRFVLLEAEARIAPEAREIAINVSNYRHWDEPTRVWLDDCLRGRDGPRGRDYNMRWTASPVAEFQRILRRGGVFLYPGDARRGYAHGRLRLIYEANPLAFVVEQAGGVATTGKERILDLAPRELHEHTPVVAGAREDVEYYGRLRAGAGAWSEQSPLFARRGLFRTS